MVFWGVEIKPGKPFSHAFDPSRGRLHVSQATLGIGASEKKSLVQCNVGDKSPVLLCSLIPDKTEYCQLDIEFEEAEEVILSVLGPRSVHLSGYYLGNDAQTCGHDHDDDSDSYGEDIAVTESENSDSYDDEEGDEDEYEDDFINDDDVEMFAPPKRKSGVVIEEILDDEKPVNGNGNRKRLKKIYQMSDSDDDKQQQIVVKGTTDMSESESEDEDGLPISKKVAKGTKKAADEDGKPTGSKRKLENVVQDQAERIVEDLKDSSLPSSEVKPENNEEPKKKKKKKSKKGKTPGAGDDDKLDVPNKDATQAEEAKTDNVDQDQKVTDEKPPANNLELDAKSVDGEDKADAKKKKRKKKKNKTVESDKNANIEEEKKESVTDTEAVVEKGNKKVRTFDNGLLVEDLAMGKPDGKRASPGNKVSVHYIGKLKNNGKIFDSNTGRAPFKFCLGIGQVIKGWEVGVNGMRVGDKRRITVPPSMGYGSKGAPPQIPPNAWLVFDVELVDVRK